MTHGSRVWSVREDIARWDRAKWGYLLLEEEDDICVVIFEGRGEGITKGRR